MPGFQPFIGQHCETVATGTLLKSVGVDLSEPMLFGLGEGLAFIFINLSSLPLPFVGGRTKPFEITERLCRNLGLECSASETSSRPKAWTSLEAAIERGVPVGLQLDCFHLEYFSRPVHFAGHFVAAYGLTGQDVLLVDTAPQGSRQSTSRHSLEKARFAKGPMAAKARSWTIARPRRALNLRAAAQSAIRANAKSYLNPPFKGASFHGIRKLADSLPGWREMAKNPTQDLELAALLMERAGTGGAVFRNFYRDFLEEAAGLLGQPKPLREANKLFTESAAEWTAIAALIEHCALSGRGEPLVEAAARCRRAADAEVTAMKLLATV